MVLYNNYKKSIEYVANIIENYTKEDDNVLILGNQTVLYNYTNRHYSGKYFYQYPIMYCGDDMLQNIINDIESESPEYIVMYGYRPSLNDEAGAKFINIINEKYERVDDFIYERKK